MSERKEGKEREWEKKREERIASETECQREIEKQIE